MVLNIRNIAAFFVSSWFIASGRIKKIKQRAANGEFIISVYFHDPSKKLFESTVKWFLKNGFHFISAEELSDILRNKKPFPKSAVVFTADDGWKDNKPNIAAVANQYKIPITIFASTQPIETGEGYWWSYVAKATEKGLTNATVSGLKKVPNAERMNIVESIKTQLPLEREALTIDELKTLSDTRYVHIGSHTITHPILTQCTDEQSGREIKQSRQILEQWLQKPVKHFAYPNGEFTEREIKSLQDSGYDIAFSTIPQYINNDNRNAFYAIPRFDVLENVSFAENICRMTGIWFNRSGS